MSDVREILKRGVGGVAPPPEGFERMLRRRDRKRRNQRIRAGALGLVITVAGFIAFAQVIGSAPVPADVTPTPGPEPSPTTSPDVEPLADPGTGVHFVNVRTGKAVPLPSSITSITGAGNYDVSPDGTMILFDNAEYRPFAEEPGLHQLYVANIDGSELHQLTDDPVGASQGSWSADGRKVVYLGRYGQLMWGPADLMVLDVVTGLNTQLAHGPARAFQHPFFSGDGNEILFTRPGSIPTPGDGAPQADLWMIPVGGGEPQAFLGDRGYAAYSPDGATIAFPRIAYWRDGNSGGSFAEIWISDADGSDARMLVPSGGWHGGSGQGRWSPTGRWIFYRLWGPPSFTRSRLRILDMTTGRSTLLSAGIGQDWVDDETLIVVNR